MTNLKHIGIYVSDISKMTEFYSKCFDMRIICENVEDTGELYLQLFGAQSIVLITKLITEYGTETHQGEMIELIQVIDGVKSSENRRKVYDIGMSHFSLGVDNITEALDRVLKNGGKSITEIIDINSKLCCFCRDPENNIIELIQ